jgi:hypothetical protein
MKIFCLFGQRKEEHGPRETELMVAWDEYCVEENEEGFAEEIARAKRSWGDDLAQWRMIEVEIPDALIDQAFDPVQAQGTVVRKATDHMSNDDGKWKDGGWGFYITEYPDEGTVGPYETWAESKTAAVTIMPDDETTVVRLTAEQAVALQRELDEEAADRSSRKVDGA